MGFETYLVEDGATQTHGLVLSRIHKGFSLSAISMPSKRAPHALANANWLSNAAAVAP